MKSIFPSPEEVKSIANNNKEVMSFILGIATAQKFNTKDSFLLFSFLLHNNLINIDKCQTLIKSEGLNKLFSTNN